MKSENGSVIFIILVAVMLFAALSYTVAQMIRGGDSGTQITEQKASLLADEIMGYGRELRQSVQAMRISNGCQPEDISFEVAALAGYVHAPVASDDCKVFDPDGGGMVYSSPSTDYGDGSDWIFTGANIADGVGTAAPDLVAILPGLNLTVCTAINGKLGHSGPGGDATVSYTQFQDTYAATQTLDDAAGFAAGCLNDTTSGNAYFYYQVLISR